MSYLFKKEKGYLKKKKAQTQDLSQEISIKMLGAELPQKD